MILNWRICMNGTKFFLTNSKKQIPNSNLNLIFCTVYFYLINVFIKNINLYFVLNLKLYCEI